MKKVMIICAAGMSSSMIAKKITDYFKEQKKAIEVSARGIMSVEELVTANENDLYLISPQTRMHFERIKQMTDTIQRKTIQIPPTSYVPTQKGVESLANLIETEISEY